MKCSQFGMRSKRVIGGYLPRNVSITPSQDVVSVPRATTLDIDRSEYVTGYSAPTILGKLAESLFPAPIRFCVCWVPPILTIASCHALTVMSGISKATAITLNALPGLESVVNSVLQPCYTPALITATTVAVHILPILFAFVALPLLDLIFGEEESQAFSDPANAWQKAIYHSVCLVFAALHITAFASAATAAAHSSWPVVMLLSLNLAVASGFSFVVAHELIHSRTMLAKFTGQILLTLNWYKHWGHSHMAHHAQVATKRDPASARLRESVYPFLVRCISGEWKDAVRMETSRVARDRPGLPFWLQLLTSRVLGWIAFPALVTATLHVALGPKAMAMHLMSSAGGIFFLTVINYIEHYGLSRAQVAGRPNPVTHMHSWNANHLVSNASMLRLQRHTDHHMHGQKPFYRLENVEGAPKLPANYSIMLLMALVPPLWFAVMNPRVHLYAMLSDVAACPHPRSRPRRTSRNPPAPGAAQGWPPVQ